MTFKEYMELLEANEGLWMPDDNAIPGLSRIVPPTPPKKGKWPKLPKLKPAPDTCEGEVSFDQLHQAVDALSRLGIGLLPPKRDDIKRLIDKQKAQVTVPQQHQTPEKAFQSPLGRSATVGPNRGKPRPGMPS